MGKTQLMTIIEFCHYDYDGTILFKQENINNIFHSNGQDFVHKILFNTAAGATVPTNYYLGLDARLTLAYSDTFSSLVGEPVGNGYARQPVSSLNGFTIDSGVPAYSAKTPAVAYTATGSGWGPVRNVFLATTIDNTGVLLASSILSTPRSLSAGQSISLRMKVSLGGCP